MGKSKDSTEKSKGLVSSLKELIPYIVILVVVIVIRTYLITPIKVQGQSMYPTLNGKEFMILKKYDKDFERFDIVVLKTDHDDIIKRIIALPGETIACENGNIYINGKKFDEKYGSGITSDFKKIKLGKDEYFVLGDNREDSLDSRYYGPFSIDKIKGKTDLVLFPFNKIGHVE